jgi:2-keto-3-deoxy-L-rhamnonate aldolase RhmA
MSEENIREFKKTLHRDFVLVLFSKTSDPGFIEVMGYAGFDFMIIDLEHWPNAVHSTLNLVRAAGIGGVLPIVRVKEDNWSVAGEVLDIGAWGVQVPQVNGEKQALGVPGETEHPIVEEKMREIVRTSLQRNVAVGTFVDTLENALKWRETEVRYIACSVDVGIFHDACKNLVKTHSA